MRWLLKVKSLAPHPWVHPLPSLQKRACSIGMWQVSRQTHQGKGSRLLSSGPPSVQPAGTPGVLQPQRAQREGCKREGERKNNVLPSHLNHSASLPRQFKKNGVKFQWSNTPPEYLSPNLSRELPRYYPSWCILAWSLSVELFLHYMLFQIFLHSLCFASMTGNVCFFYPSFHNAAFICDS